MGDKVFGGVVGSEGVAKVAMEIAGSNVALTPEQIIEAGKQSSDSMLAALDQFKRGEGTVTSNSVPNMNGGNDPSRTV